MVWGMGYAREWVWVWGWARGSREPPGPLTDLAFGCVRVMLLACVSLCLLGRVLGKWLWKGCCKARPPDSRNWFQCVFLWGSPCLFGKKYRSAKCLGLRNETRMRWG